VTAHFWNGAVLCPVLRGSASLPSVALGQNASRLSLSLLLASSVLVPLAVYLPDANTTHCDDPNSGSSAVESANDAAVSNPLWPSGVSGDMVNRYVDEFLADPNINIKSVPDSMERIIYTSTVRLTLNTVYEVASWLHGTEVLGHRLVLARSAAAPADDTIALDLQLNTGKNKVNYYILETMADELLKNKAINQRWLPDIIEKQIYVNCLRIIFTIIDRIADTMAFHMCGHHLCLSFEPLDQDKARALVERHSSIIEIDESALDAIVDGMVQESHEASPTTEAISYLPGYRSFLKTLHKTLCMCVKTYFVCNFFASAGLTLTCFNRLSRSRDLGRHSFENRATGIGG